MVITEAKALGVPVIATRTSGALEQIEDGKNGVLCGFSDEEIAESLRAFLTGGAAETLPPGRETVHRAETSAGHTGSAYLENDHRKRLASGFDDINWTRAAPAPRRSRRRAPCPA